MRLPGCRKDHSEAEILSAAGSILAARRKTNTAGPGRPRTQPRCPCGAMTVERAAKRRHYCRIPLPLYSVEEPEPKILYVQVKCW